MPTAVSGQSPPTNFGFVVVPQQSAFVIEQLGQFHKVLDPGFHFLIPFVHKVAYVHSLKEMALPIPGQSAITLDNVHIQIDGVLYVKVTDPKKASYGVQNVLFALSQLAQTTMRSELGKISLDKTFADREQLNKNIVKSINEASEPWGIECMRYEIRDIAAPRGVQAAMELQAEAERKKRAEVLISEGERQTDVNIAEGRRQAAILEAEGAAQEILLRAEATGKGIRIIADAIGHGNGKDAVSMRLAENYLQSFGNIAKESNTVVLPANAGDVASMVSHATAIFNSLNTANDNREQSFKIEGGSGGTAGKGGIDKDVADFEPEPFPSPGDSRN